MIAAPPFLAVYATRKVAYFGEGKEEAVDAKWLLNNPDFTARFQQSSGGREQIELGQSDAERKILGVCW